VKVEVKGAARKIDQIFRFDKAVWRDMQKGVREAGNSVASDAAGRMPGQPLRNWGLWFSDGRNLSYEGGVRRMSVSVRSKETQGFRQVKAKVGFASGNVAGAIYGLAGSQPGTKSTHPAGPVRSRNFKAALNRRQGGGFGVRRSQFWPRALTPAYYAKGPQARDRIGQAVERAVAAVNR
jgi:hypothetical protein